MQDRREIRLRGREADRRAARCEVHARAGDAGLARQPRFEQPDARTAAHALDEQRDFAVLRVDARYEVRGSLGLTYRVVVRGRRRCSRALVAQRVERRQAGDTNGLRDREAARAAESRGHAVDVGFPARVRRDALSAVVARRAQRSTSTGISLCVSTLCVSLPSSTPEMPRRPCDAMQIRSHFFFFAVAITVFQTSLLSARTESSTTPAPSVSLRTPEKSSSPLARAWLRCASSSTSSAGPNVP